jgi:hypothetical protein
MPRDGLVADSQITAANLRLRAARARRLMGGMVGKADYDRLLEYSEELERPLSAFPGQ